LALIYQSDTGTFGSFANRFERLLQTASHFPPARAGQINDHKQTVAIGFFRKANARVVMERERVSGAPKRDGSNASGRDVERRRAVLSERQAINSSRLRWMASHPLSGVL
jgi:hypothetical protein